MAKYFLLNLMLLKIQINVDIIIQFLKNGLKWIAINVKEMTCSFSHLTEFAIFTIKTENSVEIKA